MTHPNTEPPRSEAIDPGTYRDLSKAFYALTFSKESQPIILEELYVYTWPPGELYEEQFDQARAVNPAAFPEELAFEIGRTRTFNIVSGPIRTSINLHAWNERIGEINNLRDRHYMKENLGVRGYPFGYIRITSDSEQEGSGWIGAIIELYQNNFIAADFALSDTCPPSIDSSSLTPNPLIKIIEFLGLNPVIIEDDGAQYYSSLDEQDAKTLGEGLVRLIQASGPEIIL